MPQGCGFCHQFFREAGSCLAGALDVDWKIHQLRQMTAMPMQGGRSLAVYFQELDLLGRS